LVIIYIFTFFLYRGAVYFHCIDGASGFYLRNVSFYDCSALYGDNLFILGDQNGINLKERKIVDVSLEKDKEKFVYSVEQPGSESSRQNLVEVIEKSVIYTDDKLGTTTVDCGTFETPCKFESRYKKDDKLDIMVISEINTGASISFMNCIKIFGRSVEEKSIVKIGGSIECNTSSLDGSELEFLNFIPTSGFFVLSYFLYYFFILFYFFIFFFSI
jgi:hypothetical protein